MGFQNNSSIPDHKFEWALRHINMLNRDLEIETVSEDQSNQLLFALSQLQGTIEGKTHREIKDGQKQATFPKNGRNRNIQGKSSKPSTGKCT